MQASSRTARRRRQVDGAHDVRGGVGAEAPGPVALGRDDNTESPLGHGGGGSIRWSFTMPASAVSAPGLPMDRGYCR